MPLNQNNESKYFFKKDFNQKGFILYFGIRIRLYRKYSFVREKTLIPIISKLKKKFGEIIEFSG